MPIESLIELTPVVNSEVGYWFIRTDGGENFDTFFENSFIGIGWDFVTVADIRKLSVIALKDKIAQKYHFDTSKRSGKQKTTSIYNKIARFDALSKGDMVMIPSSSSNYFAFGVITDDRIYSDAEPIGDCYYHKRRKVRWLRKEHIGKLDSKFYQIKISRHAISDISEYSEYIDSAARNLYTKNDYSHYVLDIKKHDKIDVDDLIGLADHMKTLISKIDDYFNLDEIDDDLFIKLNIQSPGHIEFFTKKMRSLVILSSVLTIMSCEDPSQTNLPDDVTRDGISFIEQNSEELEELKQIMTNLETNTDTIKNTFATQ